ncbi:60S ribosomal protein L28-1 [Hibiscus syriacus]|uniref:60S ribosomal protein L28-1 n=1 Tax=Hibiscus syriacus TaxID=106335 RepID=A0A6A3BRU1_HIBSY|nr:60S ribosomal protein L28-1 [Hibiscus syriacus]
MTTVSGQLIWDVMKKNNCFLVKQFRRGTAGVRFSKEPNNLHNLNSYKHAGLTNKKTATIQPGGKGQSRLSVGGAVSFQVGLDSHSTRAARPKGKRARARKPHPLLMMSLKRHVIWKQKQIDDQENRLLLCFPVRVMLQLIQLSDFRKSNCAENRGVKVTASDIRPKLGLDNSGGCKTSNPEKYLGLPALIGNDEGGIYLPIQINMLGPVDKKKTTLRDIFLSQVAAVLTFTSFPTLPFLGDLHSWTSFERRPGLERGWLQSRHGSGSNVTAVL